MLNRLRLPAASELPWLVRNELVEALADFFIRAYDDATTTSATDGTRAGHEESGVSMVDPAAPRSVEESPVSGHQAPVERPQRAVATRKGSYSGAAHSRHSGAS